MGLTIQTSAESVVLRQDFNRGCPEGVSMLIYCPICGYEHENDPPTDEEAMKGAVILGLLMQEITPQYADAYDKYRQALKKMLVEG